MPNNRRSHHLANLACPEAPHERNLLTRRKLTFASEVAADPPPIMPAAPEAETEEEATQRQADHEQDR